MTVTPEKAGGVRKWLWIGAWFFATVLILAAVAIYALVRISMSID